MSAVFLKILNMSITASWLILAVALARALLKKAPKWIVCLLWALVAIRLVCPFIIESAFSLISSRETIPADLVLSPFPAALRHGFNSRCSLRAYGRAIRCILYIRSPENSAVSSQDSCTNLKTGIRGIAILSCQKGLFD
jgi:hypothetical protein